MEASTQRTSDVEIIANIPFSKMMLSNEVLTGLTNNGFIYPSPIQLRAIPIGCCGLDLLMKAKSGTGKTLVFCTLILEKYKSDIKSPQSLIVVPTREISEQIKAYLNDVGKLCPGFKAASFIGGRDIAEDRKAIGGCRAVVGTPGRLLHLISNHVLRMEEIKLFVLDEADKLLNEGFQSDVKKLIRKLSCKNVQMVASSATYSDETNKILLSLMKNPIGVTPSLEAPVLLGVKQYIYTMEDDEDWLSTGKQPVSIRTMTSKVEAINNIFANVAFKQAIVFSNSQMRAESYRNYLLKSGWKTDVISGSQDQSVRLGTFHRFKTFQTRILVATDLMARGIDVENINLVINLDVPAESATYLHRIGRCGRFGSQGTAITIIGNQYELLKFNRMLDDIGGDQLNVLNFRKENRSEGTNENNSNEVNITQKCNKSDENFGNSMEGSKVYLSAESETNGKASKKVKKQQLQANVEKSNIDLLKITKLMIEEPGVENMPPVNLDLDLFDKYSFAQNGTIRESQTRSSISSMTSKHIPAPEDLNRSKGNDIELNLNLFDSYKTDIAQNSYVKTSEKLPVKCDTELNDGNASEPSSDDSHITNSSINGNLDDNGMESGSSSGQLQSDNESDSTSGQESDADDEDGMTSTAHKRSTAAGSNTLFLQAFEKLNVNDKTSTANDHPDEFTERLRSLKEKRNTESALSLGDSDDSSEQSLKRHSRQKKKPINCSKNNHAAQRNRAHQNVYSQQFASWSRTYWNQVNQIQRYVRFAAQQPVTNYFY